MSPSESTASLPGLAQVESALRLVVGFVYVGVIIFVLLLGLVALLPFGRRARVLFTNRIGSILGQGVMAISGSRLQVLGRENAHSGRPVIFANNHTSTLDAFTTIWLTPQGTVGLAKKEIIFYPFYGIGWILSGQPIIDRSNPERAKASMKALGDLVSEQNFSVCMLPEGTRSRDGCLQPFKKGIVHLALQTKLPIVPMVTIGAAGAWDRGRWVIRRRDIAVHFLPPIETAQWSADRVDEHLEELRQRFVEMLPSSMLRAEDQQNPVAA